MVLGLRDIEDNPARVRRAWGAPGLRAAIERCYDAVLVYGPGSTPDAIDCTGWDLEVPVRHVGYVSRARDESGHRPSTPIEEGLARYAAWLEAAMPVASAA